MLARKRLLMDLLLHENSDPRERTIIELSSRLKIMQNRISHLLKGLRAENLVFSPAILVSHPSSRRRVKCFALTEAGRKDAELHFDAVKGNIIWVKDRDGNLKKVEVSKLPASLDFDIKSLASLLSLVRDNLLDVADLMELTPPVDECKKVISEIGKAVEKVRALTVSGRLSAGEIEEMVKIKNTLDMDIGISFLLKAEYKKGIAHFKSIISSAIANNDRATAADAYINLAHVYYEMDQSRKALEYYYQGRWLLKMVKDKRMLARAFMGMSGVYYKMGDYSNSNVFLKKAIILFREFGDMKVLSDAYSNLGILYRDGFGNLRKAADACRESLRIKELIDDKRGVAHTYWVLGVLRMDMGMHIKAIKLFEDSIKASQELGYNWLLSYNYCYLAKALLKIGDMEKSLKTVKTALKLSKEIGVKENEIRASIIHADILNKMRRWKKASRLLNDSIESSMRLKNFPLLCEAYMSYGALERNRGNLRKAKHYYGMALRISTRKRIYVLKKVINKHIRSLTTSRLG